MSIAEGRRLLSFTIVGLVLAAVPFAFGTLRFIETLSDTRYLWTAVASTLGAIVVASPRAWTRRPLALHAIAATLGAALGAVLCALLLGVPFGLAMVMVSGAFGLFSGAGAALLWRRTKS